LLNQQNASASQQPADQEQWQAPRFMLK